MAFETITTVALASDGSGDVSLNVHPNQSGKLKLVRYVPDGTVPMTGTPTLTLAGAATGAVLFGQATVSAGNTAQEWAPQHLGAKSSDGTALTTATDVVVAEDISLSMSGCGSNKKATLYLIIGD